VGRIESFWNPRRQNDETPVSTANRGLCGSSRRAERTSPPNFIGELIL
jgi:hypothetical protein